jgi:uncharacterized protein
MIPEAHTAIRYRSPAGLRNPHLQSILASSPLRRRLLGSPVRALLAASRPEIIACDDARLLGFHAPAVGESRGLVVFLHGWEGCADSHYVLSAAARVRAAGFDTFRLNFRDHGGTASLNEELFHSCRLEEVLQAVGVVVRRRPAQPAWLVGYSLGGNFALRVAARAPQAGVELAGVMALCPVLSPHSTMDALESGPWFYRRHFLNRWRRSLQAKADAFPHRYAFGDLRRLGTLTATTDFFVRNYTAYADLDSYLSGYAITGNVLAGLRVPSMLIAAEDDPVIPVSDLAHVAHSQSLRIVVTPHGGHCAFLHDFRLRSWLDEVVLKGIGAD